MGALRSALAAKLADGKLIVVNSFDMKEAKTKEFRKSLNSLHVDKTVLVVEEPRHENHNLGLSARNIQGLELVLSNEVHPYHLLKYDRAIFSQPAIEKLQVSLKASVSKRQHKPEEDEGTKKAHSERRKRTRHDKAAEVA
jgi:large subunit ribosomal protein L4